MLEERRNGFTQVQSVKTKIKRKTFLKTISLSNIRCCFNFAEISLPGQADVALLDWVGLRGGLILQLLGLHGRYYLSGVPVLSFFRKVN